MSIKKLLITFIFIVFVVKGCGLSAVDNTGKGKAVDNSNDINNSKVEDDDNLIINPNNKLGFALLEKVESDEGENIFISPTSALMALAMVYNGAAGETKAEIAKALLIEHISVAELNDANASLMSILDKDSEEIQLSIANSIWLNENLHLTDEFAQNMTDYYDAKTTEIDIEDDTSVDKINHWVQDATNEKIDEIVKAPLDSRMAALLINAIYFKGEWKYALEEARTENRSFYSPNGEKEVPLMMLEEKLDYLENKLFQAVKLPYGTGEMSMTVVLPHEHSSIEKLMKKITLENWQAWQEDFEEMNGTIRLPKFTIEYEAVLNQALKQLGIASAFQKGSANFSHMILGSDPLWVDEVKQKTFIDVNEEGTEAAAVTSVTILQESSIVEDTFYMEVNRPFFVAITDEQTGAILFMGSITNPDTALN